MSATPSPVGVLRPAWDINATIAGSVYPWPGIIGLSSKPLALKVFSAMGLLQALHWRSLRQGWEVDEDLIKNDAKQKILLTNPDYSKIGPGVEAMQLTLKLLDLSPHKSHPRDLHNRVLTQGQTLDPNNLSVYRRITDNLCDSCIYRQFGWVKFVFGSASFC